jgi:formiminoglutamase
LGEVVERWTGGPPGFHSGQPVLLGFPCDEGVRRNGGRPGAALAPDAIRTPLYRMTAWHGPEQLDLADVNLCDLGNLRLDADLESGQQRLGMAIGELLRAKAVPIVIGGGHETTYGHYLGYVDAHMDCAILNVDAHLDVRQHPAGGHSGSSFRQAMEHPTHPLKLRGYTVLGAQAHSVARVHEEYVRRHGGRIFRHDEITVEVFVDELKQHAAAHQPVLLTIDADAFRQADVPGVSAPNPTGLDGSLWPLIAYQAGASACVTSLDLVEVNPHFDRDQQTARWAASGIREFLVGLAQRRTSP